MRRSLFSLQSSSPTPGFKLVLVVLICRTKGQRCYSSFRIDSRNLIQRFKKKAPKRCSFSWDPVCWVSAHLKATESHKVRMENNFPWYLMLQQLITRPRQLSRRENVQLKNRKKCFGLGHCHSKQFSSQWEEITLTKMFTLHLFTKN